jgi:hypothetical protein
VLTIAGVKISMTRYMRLTGCGNLRMRSAARKAQFDEGELLPAVCVLGSLRWRFCRPQKVGLSEYLASLTRVNEGLVTLKKSNLRSTQKAVQQMVEFRHGLRLQTADHFRRDCSKLGVFSWKSCFGKLWPKIPNPLNLFIILPNVTFSPMISH